METYLAIWQIGPNSATDDVKDFPRRVRKELFELSKEVLVDTPDPALIEDEQIITGAGLMMRRAARREDMRALSELEDGAEGTPATVGLWYLYRTLNPAEINEHRGTGYFIVRVIGNDQLAWALQQIQTSKQ